MAFPNIDAASSDPWLQKAKDLSKRFLLGTAVFAAGGLTIGLVTGLILLMLPVYVIAAVCTVAAVCVCLCLWRRWYVAAIILGSLILLTPTVMLVSWYALQRRRCIRADDPQACFAYLNGSSLLPIFVGICCAAAVAGCVIIFRTVRRQQHARSS